MNVERNTRNQPCQNVPAASNFAAFSQLLAAYSILDFTGSLLAGKGTWHLLPTAPAILPTARKHFDRAEETKHDILYMTLMSSYRLGFAQDLSISPKLLGHCPEIKLTFPLVTA